ncbi:MAG TPA: SDR family NAD(P)-dependent oxidoreductase, partial [Novosphingobium sp.]|nr:SDR family NAD(P)-dependent oxidoreductase [Novosphingobium sp.]
MTVMGDFEGRSALITGAGSGIGAACVALLIERGVSELVLVDLDPASLDGLDISLPTRRYAGDVADPALWQRIEQECPRLDLAVLNAGIADSAPIMDIDFAQWRKV